MGSFHQGKRLVRGITSVPSENTVGSPLIWPPFTGVQSDVPSFAGHTNTVPDIVGRIGRAPSLVIFTEGNHLAVLLSSDIAGAFPSWARSQSRYADLDLDNLVIVTLPQPIVVQMVRTGEIALGNLTLDVSRTSGFYPDIVMGGPEPLQQLHALGVVEPQARFFSRPWTRAARPQRQPTGDHRPYRCSTRRCTNSRKPMRWSREREPETAQSLNN